jgi:CPA1 family monovalent cation:H+ antiporter
MSRAASEAAIARARTEAVEAHAFAPDGTLIHPQLLEQSRRRLEVIQRYAADADTFMVGVRTHFDVVLIALAAGRAELIRIHRAGLIEDEVLHDLERDLDVEELGIILQRGE